MYSPIKLILFLDLIPLGGKSPLEKENDDMQVTPINKSPEADTKKVTEDEKVYNFICTKCPRWAKENKLFSFLKMVMKQAFDSFVGNTVVPYRHSKFSLSNH